MVKLIKQGGPYTEVSLTPGGFLETTQNLSRSVPQRYQIKMVKTTHHSELGFQS